MTKGKRGIVLLLLSVFFWISCLFPRVNAVAESELTFSIKGGSIRAGEKQTYSLTIEENPGFTMLYLKITFDPRLVSLDCVKDTELLTGFELGAQTESSVVLAWDNSFKTKNFTEKGALVELVFLGLQEGEGEIAISLGRGGCCNAELSSVPVKGIPFPLSVLGDIVNDPTKVEEKDPVPPKEEVDEPTTGEPAGEKGDDPEPDNPSKGDEKNDPSDEKETGEQQRKKFPIVGVSLGVALLAVVAVGTVVILKKRK